MCLTVCDIYSDVCCRVPEKAALVSCVVITVLPVSDGAALVPKAFVDSQKPNLLAGWLC